MINEIQKQLPRGWVKTTLGEVLEFKYGRSLPAKNRESGDYPVYGSNGEIGRHSVPFTQGPVLIVGRKGSIGEVHLSNEQCWPIDTTYYIDNFYGQTIEFWFHLLRSLRLADLDRATALPGLNRNDAYESPIDVPPLNEQKRIVARIEGLQVHTQHAREALETVLELLEQLRQSILAAAFRGDLTREWRKQNPDAEPASELLKRIRAERRKRWEKVELEKLKSKGLSGHNLNEEFLKRRKQYKEPMAVDASDLHELPDGWCWASINELSDSLDYGTSAKSSKTGKVPVLRMGNLQNGEIDWLDLAYSSNESEIEKYRLAPNTVLFNRTNSPELVGKTALYRGEEEAIFAGYLIRIRQVPEVLAAYLNLMLNSPFVRLLCLKVKSDAVSQSNINANKLSAFPVPLCSQDEQKLIVSKAGQILAEIKVRKQWTADCLDTLNQFDQSVLAKAFRGELVAQDHNDEPASVLLERIRVARATKNANPKLLPTDRIRTVPKMTIESVKEAIHQMPEDTFSFDELRSTLTGDYDSLKEMIFALLDENQPSLKQFFDQEVQAIRFVRVER